MNDLQLKVFSFHYLHLFPPLAAVLFRDNFENRSFFSLRLHVCVVVFIHEKEICQCFSCLLSRHFPPCFDHML